MRRDTSFDDSTKAASPTSGTPWHARAAENVTGDKRRTVSHLSDLLRQLREKEPSLSADLEREVTALAERRAFGLNFERHVPEAVELPGRRVRKGDKVRVLQPRGQASANAEQSLWRVVAIDRNAGEASLEQLDGTGVMRSSLDDLVVVAEFRDPIYPGLVSTGKVERGGDKPYHTVINAENYHALETLLFTHRGKIDCIYIDPPYNTGAKDWKYNNDYVEGDDLYRHSKWLAFMERRLLLAKELLNPADSVLIVTIDEKECARLGLLLEQTFPDANTQMVSIVINPLGQERGQQLARVEEYAYFLFFGVAVPSPLADDLLNRPTGEEIRVAAPGVASPSGKVRWEWLLRGGVDASRQRRPDLFYPVFVDPERHSVQSVGDPIPLEVSRNSVSPPSGTIAVWPIRTDGQEGRWRCSPRYYRELLASGYAKVGEYDRANDRWALLYLGKAQISRVERGEVEVLGRGTDGSLTLGRSAQTRQLVSGKTVWNRPSHRSGEYGTLLNRTLIPGRRFPYPKSLYVVEDALRVIVANRPRAVILDFFAGSGTTAHAVMRLNKQDGGRRQCISITNNEVAADEQRALRAKGLRPGDPDWEQWGICDYITKPRIEAAITGRTPDGDPIKGDYKFTDEFPMADGFEENAEFFTLTYEAPLRVASHREFERIAPLLWLRAGAEGRRIEEVTAGWDVADTYGVLADLDQTEDFLKAIAASERVHIAYIVTDEDRLFESVAQTLPDNIESVRLYESYLRNFEIESGRGAL